MSDITQVIPAKDVREGDFFPGLDNGYVPYPPMLDGNELEILFHTAEGEEATLRCPGKMPVTVRRSE